MSDLAISPTTWAQQMAARRMVEEHDAVVWASLRVQMPHLPEVPDVDLVRGHLIGFDFLPVNGK